VNPYLINPLSGMLKGMDTTFEREEEDRLWMWLTRQCGLSILPAFTATSLCTGF